MNIFITGSNGFVGSHLKQKLDGNSSYKLFTPSSKELDLTNELDVEDYIKKNKIDYIIHLANRGGGRDTLDMTNVTEYNLRIFFNIVKNSNIVKKIISFGSGAEYAKHKPIVDAKEDDYLNMLPLDEYGFYKWVTSRFIEKSQNIVQLRIFGAYGEFENYRFKFISNAIVKNILELPIVINKNVFFDYIYIDDLIEMICHFIHNDGKHKTYNVTTGKKVDLLSLANFVNDASSFKSQISVLNDGLNNEYTSNNDRILQEMPNFKFTTHLDAIKKMRDYYIKNLDSLDTQTVKQDPYLQATNKIWKGKQ